MRSLKRTVAFFFMVCAFSFGRAQTITWEDFVEQMAVDGYADEEEEGGGQQEIFEELLEIHRQPFDINTVDSLSLLRLPFLSEKAISAILRYRKYNQPFQTLGELHLIGELSFTMRRYLSLFLYCKSVHPYYDSKWFAPYSSEIASRVDVPLYKRAGYRSFTADELAQSPNKAYLGNSLYSSLRYRYNNNRLYYGLTVEKDPGEPFASKDNLLFDSYNFFVYRETAGLIRTWALGDYRVNFGQGLAIGSGFFNNALSLLTSDRGAINGIRRHSSTDEVNYLRGAAVSLGLKSFVLTVFASYRQIDATLRGDSVVSSFKTDGYHRTPLEMSKKNNVELLALGSHLQWYGSFVKWGVTAVYHHYDTSISPSTKLYNRYSMRGKSFLNLSTDYSLRHGKFSLNGETATSNQGGIATLNTLRYTFSYQNYLFLLQRMYSFRYVSPSSFSYSAGSKAQNEQGVMLGANIFLNKKLSVTGYIDAYSFPWATFRVANQPSEGFKALIQAMQQFGETSSLLLRYQTKCWQQDIAEQDNPARFYNHSVRVQFSKNIGKWSLVSAFNGVVLIPPNKENGKGWAISQRVGYKFGKDFRLAVMSAYFHTDDYNTRVYVYEPNLLYASSFPTCYYRGVRLVALAKKMLWKDLEVTARYALTHYFDRNTISSGTQQIFSPSKNDLSFQVRYMF